MARAHHIRFGAYDRQFGFTIPLEFTDLLDLLGERKWFMVSLDQYVTISSEDPGIKLARVGARGTKVYRNRFQASLRFGSAGWRVITGQTVRIKDYTVSGDSVIFELERPLVRDDDLRARATEAAVGLGNQPAGVPGHVWPALPAPQPADYANGPFRMSDETLAKLQSMGVTLDQPAAQSILKEDLQAHSPEAQVQELPPGRTKRLADMSPRERLKHYQRKINEFKDQMGEDLRIKVTPDGKLQLSLVQDL